MSTLAQALASGRRFRYAGEDLEGDQGWMLGTSELNTRFVHKIQDQDGAVWIYGASTIPDGDSEFELDGDDSNDITQ